MGVVYGWWSPISLQFPNAVALNAVGPRNRQMSAEERRRLQNNAKGRKRAFLRKKCKQPGLKQPGLELPNLENFGSGQEVCFGRSRHDLGRNARDQDGTRTGRDGPNLGTWMGLKRCRKAHAKLDGTPSDPGWDLDGPGSDPGEGLDGTPRDSNRRLGLSQNFSIAGEEHTCNSEGEDQAREGCAGREAQVAHCPCHYFGVIVLRYSPVLMPSAACWSILLKSPCGGGLTENGSVTFSKWRWSPKLCIMQGFCSKFKRNSCRRNIPESAANLLLCNLPCVTETFKIMLESH